MLEVARQHVRGGAELVLLDAGADHVGDVGPDRLGDVVTFTGRPVRRATRTASATASECGLRYSDMATVGTPSVKSSTRRPMMPASQRPSGTL